MMPRKIYLDHWAKSDEYLRNISHYKFQLRPLVLSRQSVKHLKISDQKMLYQNLRERRPSNRKMEFISKEINS